MSRKILATELSALTKERPARTAGREYGICDYYGYSVSTPIKVTTLKIAARP
ncbi:Uncharacterised protein [Yersinia pseudotuberculosis]|uniref:Uncharacterized protein n=1 Tax=Yersinia pseudotuberculosis TaxID=633 RepID=A0A380Q4S5_YERPU|nr:Uncharacterised protein [Yersinia pseudotuberculosis]SUP80569.1 Uncharacterised protein [Yersinia pseudotuberculosis]